MRPFLAAAAAVLLTSSCGYIGDPMVPLANVPGKITDLDAVQVGPRLLVHFTVPARTTEGVAIKSPLTLDLRIAPAGEPFPDAAKTVPPASIKDGVAHYDIPAVNWAGKEVRIAARAIAANNKDSGWSNELILPVLPPPAKPPSLQAQATAAGVHLTWEGGSGEYRVFRRGADEKTFSRVADVQQNEWTDSAIEFGKTYTYFVQRVVKLENGKEAESEPSPQESITPVDTFPPAVPSGVRATVAANSVELAWGQNTESDLAGYRVYRALAGGPFEKIADTSQIPSYSDHAVEPGKSYQYAISAVDQAGNESVRSAPVAAVVQ